MDRRSSHPAGSRPAAAGSRAQRLRVRRVAAAVPLAALWLAALSATAGESRLSGVVRDPQGRPVADAGIALEDAGATATTDDAGRFVIELPAGAHVLLVSHPDFETVRHELDLDDEGADLELRLGPPVRLFETLTVSAVRAGDEVPVTKRDLGAEEIAALHHGQDVTFLLTSTPSVTSYSDSGIGNNYSYFSLRGIHQTRINMTLDGAPLNDPAENALYFNNFTDFASSIDSIQIQRGVGTSTVGSPSYGGSIDFASVEPTQEAEGHARIGFGSYGTRRATAAYQSGFLPGGLAIYGRVSFNETDGYRDRSGVDQHSVFLSAVHHGERSQLKLTAFSGREESELSFLAVDPETLRTDPTFNPLAEEERDRFGQDFAQLRYTRALVGGKTLTASLYYNGAQGWFRLWDDSIARNDLFEFSIDGHFIGSMVTLSGQKGRLDWNSGLHHNDFRRDHFLHLESVQQYRNTGFKRETNAFVKVGWDLGRWYLFGDAQVRYADFRYRGDIDLGSVDWTFFDPKLGARLTLSDGLSLYASLGKASREPTRMDLLSGEDNATVMHDLEAVRSERVVDFEAGLDLRRSDLSLTANLYAMEFRDEIAATGELSEIGLPLRRNVDESFRRGLELDLRWRFTPRWSLTHNSNFSRNRIREWTQFYDVFDTAGSYLGSEPRTHRDVPPLLTPEVIVNQGLEYAHGHLGLALAGRWVGDSHLDNTGDDALRAPSYFQLDFRGSLELDRRQAIGRPKITLHLNNVLDEDDLYPSGYSYLFFTRDEAGRDTAGGLPFYYPLAARNFVVTVDFHL